MDRDSLLRKINEEMENENYTEVIKYWNEYAEKELDFNDYRDKLICDAISYSYKEMGLNDQAMVHINSRINFMETYNGENDRVADNYSNWDLYYVMKSNILFEKGMDVELYKFSLEYKKYGGVNPLYLSALKIIEDEFYIKHIKPVLYKLIYGLSIFIPCMIILSILFPGMITTSPYYYLAIGLGLLMIVLYLYSNHVFKIMALSIYRLIA